jgi:uncharacterized SAM-binding protein YcdF (DUF218 family)
VNWRWPALALSGIFAAALLWLAGFTVFEQNARRVVSSPPISDGIVALTGGADRIETALRLFADGKAPRLLISGVGAGADLAEYFHRVPIDPALLATRITLGRAATDTVGNAAETAAWARQNDLHTIIVVTAGYHMARALHEIARELPDVKLRAVPVRSPALRSRDDLPTMRLLAIEYDKLLAVWSGFNRLMTKGSKP